jgi:hypothetical protein
MVDLTSPQKISPATARARALLRCYMLLSERYEQVMQRMSTESATGAEQDSSAKCAAITQSGDLDENKIP